MTEVRDNPPTPQAPASRRRRLNPWIVLGIAAVFLALINYRPDIDAIACDAEVLAGEPDVVMLGTSWCPYCYEARKYFQANGIDYCEYDIERSAEGRQRYEQLNGGPIPVLIFGEKYRLDGFDERIVERALGRLEQERDQNDS